MKMGHRARVLKIRVGHRARVLKIRVGHSAILHKIWIMGQLPFSADTTEMVSVSCWIHAGVENVKILCSRIIPVSVTHIAFMFFLIFLLSHLPASLEGLFHALRNFVHACLGLLCAGMAGNL